MTEVPNSNSEFYDALERSNLTKVEALQKAQQAFINAADDDSRGGFTLASDAEDLAIEPHGLTILLVTLHSHR